MNSPFQFGKVVGSSAFTDRRSETKHLLSNFNNQIHTIILSPRRWGKTSLVNKAGSIFSRENKSHHVCFLDLFNVRTEQEFYNYFAKEVIKSTSTKWQEWAETAKRFLSHLKLTLKFSTDPASDFDLGLDYTDSKQDFKEVLNLGEQIAKEKKLKLLICIDEFQSIAGFDNHEEFQRKLRANWQHHQHVVYCLYGSKRHMLMEFFEKTEMPFYRFGEVMYLGKIVKEDWIRFITKKFEETNKKISAGEAGQIADLMQCHSYYVQQLAHIVWVNTDKKVTAEIFTKSVTDLLDHNSILFEQQLDGLSNTQVNFLRAMAAGITDNFSSKEIIDKYNFGTSANVQRILEALQNKEIIDRLSGRIELMDPAFLLWLKRKFTSS